MSASEWIPPSRRAALVRAAVAASGLSAVRFGRLIVWRDGRTVRRWLAGGPIPRAVLERLGWFVALSPAQREAVVASAAQVPPDA